MIFFQSWGDVLAASLYTVWEGFSTFVAMFIPAIIIFLIGWLIASLVGRALEQVIDATKVDSLFKKTGFSAIIEKAGYHFSLGAVFGFLAKWFIIVFCLTASLEKLQLGTVNMFLGNAVMYIGQVFIAALVLVIAAILADFVGKVVTGAAKAADSRHSDFVGKVARYSVLVFGIIVALEKIGIFSGISDTLIQALLLAGGLALGLSFGLGGKEAAASMINRLMNK